MDLERIFPQGHVCLFSSNDYVKVWRITNIPTGTLNYLRIWLQDSIVSVSIDMVQIRDNTSTFFDEYIAHRLGLIPIDSDPLRMTNFNEMNYDLCSETTCIEFNLNVNNPTQNVKNVLSKDLIWTPIGNQAQLFRDRPPKPLYDDLLIAKLLPGQEINLRCYAVRGTNAQHAKWGSVFTHFRMVSKKQILENVYTKLSQVNIKPTGLSAGGSMMSQLSALPIQGSIMSQLSALPIQGSIMSQLSALPIQGSIMSQLNSQPSTFPLNQTSTFPLNQTSTFPLNQTSTTKCIPCEQISVNFQPGNNCYYFTVELIGSLTFEDINRQLQQNFTWGDISFQETQYIY
jgi:hypothetical protein